MNRILYTKSVKRGTGTTVMDGATRVRILGNLDVKTSQDGGLEVLAGSYKTGAAPQLVIETENFQDVLDAITGQMDNQVIVAAYADGTANGRALTVKYCTATAVGDSEFPPAEGSGSVPRYQITFDVHQGAGVTTLAQAFADAAL